MFMSMSIYISAYVPVITTESVSQSRSEGQVVLLGIPRFIAFDQFSSIKILPRFQSGTARTYVVPGTVITQTYVRVDNSLPGTVPGSDVRTW
jgi:hypothetical protein